ncbi:MAG: hypothetical protein IKV83_04155 [Muribaculaceae bacterium]|nr:hypothetical protein [Muribaculaceae bacterium]
MCEDKMNCSLSDCKKPKWVILAISAVYIVVLACALDLFPLVSKSEQRSEPPTKQDSTQIKQDTMAIQKFTQIKSATAIVQDSTQKKQETANTQETTLKSNSKSQQSFQSTSQDGKDIVPLVIFVLCLTMAYFICVYFVYRLSDIYEECYIQENINNKRDIAKLEERIKKLEQP